MTAAHHSTIQRLNEEVFYLAQGAVEDAILQFGTAIANFQVDANASQYPASGSLTTTFSASPSFPKGAVVTSVITQAEPDEHQTTDPDGTIVFVKNYRVRAVAPHPQNTNYTTTLNQVIARRLIYTFQHTVFYEDDLEMLPGPPMTLSGRIHSNNNIYLGSNDTLTIDNEYLHSAAHIYNKRKDTGVVPPGAVDIKKAGTSDFPAMNGLDSDSPTWVTESQTRWNGTVKTAEHGVTQLSVPEVGSIEPGGFYDQNSDVQVVNGTVTSGGVVLLPGTDIPKGTVTTVTTFYNNRESKWVKMTNIDMKKLAGYDVKDAPGHPSFPNHLPVNGLMYATRSDTLPAQEPGIRLLNGTEIYRTGGLTIVSNDPMYIKGDYNTLNRKPTAVIGDAVNILSNNWNDSNSTKNISYRNATDTTVNTAFLAGIDKTTSGKYNGGLENYPRLHEDWSPSGQPQRTLTIRGSFVALWNSTIATGAWLYGNPQYEAPIRNWNYDSELFGSGQMPPFTPWAVEIQRGAWWKE